MLVFLGVTYAPQHLDQSLHFDNDNHFLLRIRVTSATEHLECRTKYPNFGAINCRLDNLYPTTTTTTNHDDHAAARSPLTRLPPNRHRWFSASREQSTYGGQGDLFNYRRRND